MRPKSPQRTLVAAATLLILATLAACKLDNIFFTITNQSDGTLHDVKVTYSGDTLNVGTLNKIKIETLQSSNNSFGVFGTYRHFGGPGDLAVSYSTESGRTYSHSGPRVTGDETGDVKVNIDGSDATFDTRFDVSRK